MTRSVRKLSRFTIILCLTLTWLTACSTSYKSLSAKPLETAFANALTQFQAEFDLPGITASYVLPNAAPHSSAAGWADIEQRRPMTVESRMLAASIGKTFVAATMVSLAREHAIAPCALGRCLIQRQGDSRTGAQNHARFRAYGPG